MADFCKQCDSRQECLLDLVCRALKGTATWQFLHPEEGDPFRDVRQGTAEVDG